MSRNLHRQLVRVQRQAKEWLAGGNHEQFLSICGICLNVDLDAAERADLADLISQWPGGSGEKRFPVPHPTKTPADAFMHSGAHEKWNPEFEYARNRWALLEWLIEQTSTNN